MYEAGVDKVMKTISDRIFELMKERGMSQKTLSEKTGIAQISHGTMIWTWMQRKFGQRE